MKLITYNDIMDDKRHIFSLVIDDDNVAVWLYKDEDFKPHYFLTDDNDNSCCEVEKIATIMWNMDLVEPSTEDLSNMFSCDYCGEYFYVKCGNLVSYSWFELI